MAGDLRLIVAILRVVNDLERAGDLAYNIAKLVQLEDFREPGLKAVRSLVAELGRAAARLMGAAIDAWARKDENLAADIARQDDTLDDLHARLIEKLVELKGEDSLASGHPPGHGRPLLRAHRRPRRQPGRAGALLRHRRRGAPGLTPGGRRPAPAASPRAIRGSPVSPRLRSALYFRNSLQEVRRSAASSGRRRQGSR